MSAPGFGTLVWFKLMYLIKYWMDFSKIIHTHMGLQGMNIKDFSCFLANGSMLTG